MNIFKKTVNRVIDYIEDKTVIEPAVKEATEIIEKSREAALVKELEQDILETDEESKRLLGTDPVHKAGIRGPTIDD